MSDYDPNRELDPEAWLSLDEHERIDLVVSYHRRARVKLPNQVVHAAMHVSVENQLALSIPEVNSALRRLTGAGLNRHDSIHAIGQVLANVMYKAARNPVEGDDLNARYLADLQHLTAEKWKTQDFES